MPVPKRTARQGVGRRGEEQAWVHLSRLGYRLLARNWRMRTGELDMVVRDGEWLVFVEVRTRVVRQQPTTRGSSGGDSCSQEELAGGGRGEMSVLTYGTPEESVTPVKKKRLVSTAEAYVADMGWEGPWRIDVVALELWPDGRVVRLNHLRDAVEG